jgi:hypothetical protein
MKTQATKIAAVRIRNDHEWVVEAQIADRFGYVTDLWLYNPRSQDGYFTKAGAEAMVERIKAADCQIETKHWHDFARQDFAA